VVNRGWLKGGTGANTSQRMWGKVRRKKKEDDWEMGHGAPGLVAPSAMKPLDRDPVSTSANTCCCTDTEPRRTTSCPNTPATLPLPYWMLKGDDASPRRYVPEAEELYRRGAEKEGLVDRLATTHLPHT
jgi:hypothetical protein